jgi:ATP-binding cassette subfamily F protein 3
MVQVSNLTVEFSGKTLFDSLSFIVNPKDRIGLVGKNGVGKSTMLKIIAEDDKPTSGEVVVPENCSVGYLPQEIKSSSTDSVKDETMKAFQEAMDLEKRLADINTEIADSTEYESETYLKLLDEHDRVLNRVGMLSTNKAEGDVERVLKGLGFADSDLVRPMNEFSGGWQMRVELAKLLLKKHNLLLLDEPTNHLDIDSILWLEDFLKNYPGAVMMVSHDKEFLDNITNRTIELVFGKLYDYKVAYSPFLILREERYEQQISTFKNQAKQIAEQEKFIERFKAKASKARQAKSKLKQLDKIERVEFDELDDKKISFVFPDAPRSGKVVAHGDDLTKYYGENLILKNLQFEIERGDRVAFVGKNGQGKTTLVRMIMDQCDYDGELTLGHNVSVGYYAQIQEKSLDESVSVYDTIANQASGDMGKETAIRTLLGAFLFGPDDINKKVKVLSGGEKSRLALARLLLTPYNLLILDEPTNHLDISAKEVLKNALQKFSGTLILVSHDRDFLKGLTNKTFEFNNKKIRKHIGPVDEFLKHHQIETFRTYESSGNTTDTVIVSKDGNSKNNYQQRKEFQKNIRKAKKLIEDSEKSIEKFEKNIRELEIKMQEPDFFKNPDEARKTNMEHANLSSSLEKVMTEWEKQVEAHEAVKMDFKNEFGEA